MFRFIGRLAIFSGCVLLVLYVFLPEMAQFLIERKWGAQLKTHGIQFEMEALDFSRCLMRNIRVTDSVWMEALEVSYGFCRGKDAGFRPEIRSLMVSGLKINVFRDHQGNFRIRGLELPAAKENSSRPSSLDMKTLFLWMPQRIHIENSSLHLDLGDQELYLPFHLDIHGNPGTQEMSCTGQVQIQGNILGLAWELEYAKEGVMGPLCFSFTRKDGSLPSLALSGNLDIRPGRTQGGFPSIVFHGAALPAQQWKFSRGQENIRLFSPVCTMDMGEVDQHIVGNFVLTASQAQLVSQAGTGRLQDVRCTARFHAAPSMDVGMDMNIAAADLEMETNTIRAAMKSFHANVHASTVHDKSMAGVIEMEMTKAGLFPDVASLSIGKITARLPFVLPFPRNRNSATGPPPKGSLVVDDITSSLVPDISLNLRAGLAQKQDQTMEITGKLSCPRLAQARFQFAGKVGNLPHAHGFLNLSCPEFSLDSHEIFPLLPLEGPDLDFDLDLSGSGRVFWDKEKGLVTSGFLEIHQGNVRNTDKTFEARGVKTHIQFDDLLAPSSLPGQQVFVETIKVGNLLFHNANIRFTLEKGRSLVMENARVEWCKGLVSTEALRFPPGRDGLNLTMYCDRLQLPILLDQLGAFDSQGTGSVSGRIPVSYKDGFFSFENGFLFSTPGTGGRILLKNTSKLLAGIPMDSPQFSQLDLAREALKEFDYEWATLRLNSQKETLMMKMELNGKPAHALPFVYNREIGSFVRVDASNPGSHFQGIRLDVNLQLPFHQFIKFGNTFL